MDVMKVYEYALAREQEGRSFFRQNAGRFGHAAARGAFEKLAQEEEKHIEFIEGLIEAQKAGTAAALDAGREMEKAGFFSQRAQSEMLEQTVIEAMVPDLPVLRMAYLIERDFAEFYELAASKVSDEKARQALAMLARWERGHEKLFKEMHDKAFEEYSGMPWGG